MKQRETRSIRAAQLECRKLPDGTLQVSGYAIRFNEPSAMLDGFTEVCNPQMLTRTLKENPDILLLRDHDSSKLLARTKPGTLQLTVDGQGLRFVANMQPTDIAADTWQNLKAGNLDGCSFGFRCVEEDWSTTADGAPLRTLLDVDLWEISICSWPAYPTTSAEARSRAAELRSASTEPTKEVDGVELPRHSFAYAPAGSPPSAWKFPVYFPGDPQKSADHARLALALWSTEKGIPDSEKSEVYAKIVGAAKAHGIAVSHESLRDREDAEDWTDDDSDSDDDDPDSMTGSDEGPFDADLLDGDDDEDDDDDEEDDLRRLDRLRVATYFANLQANL